MRQKKAKESPEIMALNSVVFMRKFDLLFK